MNSEDTYKKHCATYLDHLPEKCIISSFGPKYRKGWDSINMKKEHSMEEGDHTVDLGNGRSKIVTVKNGRVTRIVYKDEKS